MYKTNRNTKRDWKTLIKGYCYCFTSNRNSLGLRKNYNICQCDANDLKFALLKKGKIFQTDLCRVLLKVGVFKHSEILQAASDILNCKVSGCYIARAKKTLRLQGFHVFKINHILKAYYKDKL